MKTTWTSPKYRAAAKGEECKLRLPGCRNEVETVVLAHRNGAGMGMKASDHDAADMCDFCHSTYDRRRFDHGVTREEIDAAFEVARLKTILNRIERGVIR